MFKYRLRDFYSDFVPPGYRFQNVQGISVTKWTNKIW